MEDQILVSCDCGCGNGFVINFKYWSENDSYVCLSSTTTGFYSQQCRFGSRIARCIKAAWFMLCGNEFYLHDIMLNKRQWNDFVDAINKIGKID